VITIVDYGMGNLRSVQKAFERIGRQARVTDRPEDVAKAERLVLPGVGAFTDAMTALRGRGLIEPIRDFCRAGRPFLGICLGLQILFEDSEEVPGCGAGGCGGEGDPTAPVVTGLGLVPGRVVRFSRSFEKQGLKVPHMGWNVAEPVGNSPLFAGMTKEKVYFYFAHSYYACPKDTTAAAAVTEYGGRFASAIRAGNIHATQFHPEKSQALGLAMLENFVNLT
jgi:imidazole glycerol-phosphate synthase subunit HisH